MVGNSEDLRHRSRGRRALRALTLAAAALLGHAAGAQLLDSTLDEVINDAIDEQVEQQLDSEITEAIEQQVENAVEQTVETAVEDVVEQQIENAVTDTIAEQVESGVIDTVQEQVESGVTGAITQQLQATIEQVVEGTIEGVVEDELEDVLDGGLEDVLDNGVGQVVEGVGEAAQRAVGGAADGAQAASETFVAGVDAEGRAAEGQVWVILVPTEHVGRIEGWGFNVRLRRTLTGLDRVLLRVDAPEDRDIAQAALDLALDAPGTTVDFNHVYAPGAEDDVESSERGLAAASRTTAAAGAASLTIGIVDSAVATTHAAFDGAEIVQQDFVPFAAPRPLEHGTAVASILVGKNGVLGRARLHAATVFFADGAGKPAATTESLVAALAWHAAEGVDVVNMSLAGPPNRVLETAITAATERGMVIVAAVGNNGPAGEPLYPAAYAPVVGITAVDSSHRIYRYANRGRHVSFAAPGVRIKVADSDGGYATESGTSMAAPYAAAIIARACAAKAAQSNGGVLATLKTTAIDLGAKDFDDVFGYGLIAAAESASAR